MEDNPTTVEQRLEEWVASLSEEERNAPFINDLTPVDILRNVREGTQLGRDLVKADFEFGNQTDAV